MVGNNNKRREEGMELSVAGDIFRCLQHVTCLVIHTVKHKHAFCKYIKDSKLLLLFVLCFEHDFLSVIYSFLFFFFSLLSSPFFLPSKIFCLELKSRMLTDVTLVHLVFPFFFPLPTALVFTLFLCFF